MILFNLEHPAHYASKSLKSCVDLATTTTKKIGHLFTLHDSKSIMSFDQRVLHHTFDYKVRF